MLPTGALYAHTTPRAQAQAQASAGATSRVAPFSRTALTNAGDADSMFFVSTTGKLMTMSHYWKSFSTDDMDWEHAGQMVGYDNQRIDVFVSKGSTPVSSIAHAGVVKLANALGITYGIRSPVGLTLMLKAKGEPRPVTVADMLDFVNRLSGSTPSAWSRFKFDNNKEEGTAQRPPDRREASASAVSGGVVKRQRQRQKKRTENLTDALSKFFEPSSEERRLRTPRAAQHVNKK